MHVPSDGWNNGGWNRKLSQFRLLAEMLGLTKPSIAPEDLQDLFKRVATAKVFADNVQSFIDAATDTNKSVQERVEAIEHQLGLTEPIPFMSLRGLEVPTEFDGVAIWPTGITNWTKLRLEQIRTAQDAGARFRHVVCLGSSRVCNAPADRRHPLITGIPVGQEPTEQALQYQLVHSGAHDPSMFRFASLPSVNDAGKPLSLEQQLIHLKESGQYDELIGGADIYVPSTPNSLYVPLHVRRVLGHDNVWFSQAGARLVRKMPDSWWPSLQDTMTLPNGMIRLWVELLEAGCFTK
ncbi:MAG: hypothetical protein JWM37_748 [Candidatus Saccharibacteria bacterium]|nr:hypothetical protein [Candidatus Saccharibacteria bacterium]